MKRLTGIPRQRVATHGDFEASAEVSQAIRSVIIAAPNWYRLSPAQREALQMIAFKIARVLAGNPDHPDHWDDICGYAQLGGRACRRKRGRR